jgi:magnesium transporter
MIMSKIKKRRHRRKNATLHKIGLPPGSLIHDGEVMVEKPEITVTDYNKDTVTHRTLHDPQELYPYMEDNSTITWVRFTGLHDTQTIGTVGAKLEIHPLVLEDVVNTSQRPKVEYYEDYCYVVIPQLELRSESEELVKRQTSLILSKGCVISYHERPDEIFEALKPRFEIQNGRFKKFGSDYLLYAIIDLIVDSYFKVLDIFSEELILLEDRIIEDVQGVSHEELHLLKRKFTQMRRYISPIHEVLASLIRDDSQLISDDVKIYFRDVNDHMNRVSENLEHLIEITATLFETHMTQVNIRTGEVMKVLTIIATIFIPLTFVVGIYGMNFNTASSPFNMPELNWYFGYPIVMGSMLILTLGMLYYFRRNRWI